MRHRLAVPRVAIFSLLLLFGSVSFGQLQHPQSPVTSPAPHKQRGFFDYVLDKVNADGKDYGASMQTGMDLVVQDTVDDLYFWSNVLTLLLLTGTAAVIFLQWRSSDKKEVIAASLIAELWNGRISDRIEIDRRTEQFNRLVETHNAEVEKALILKSQPSEKDKEAAGNLSRSVRDLAGKTATTGQKAALVQPNTAGGVSTLEVDGSAVDLQQNNLLLQRRIDAMQNNEQNLKNRLNQTTLLLDQERRRNAALKGA